MLEPNLVTLREVVRVYGSSAWYQGKADPWYKACLALKIPVTFLSMGPRPSAAIAIGDLGRLVKHMTGVDTSGEGVPIADVVGSHVIYVILLERSRVKVGSTYRPIARLAEHRRKYPRAEMIKSWAVPHSIEAFVILLARSFARSHDQTCETFNFKSRASINEFVILLDSVLDPIERTLK